MEGRVREIDAANSTGGKVQEQKESDGEGAGRKDRRCYPSQALSHSAPCRSRSRSLRLGGTAKVKYGYAPVSKEDQNPRYRSPL